MSGAVSPGSRWINQRSHHKGLEVVIDRVTDTAVYMHPVGGGGENWSTGKSKGTGTWNLPLPQFLTLYAPREKATGNATGHAYRRVAPPREPAPKEEPLPRQAALKLPPQTSAKDKSSGASVEFIDISPALARAWLDRGGVNRRLSERRVTRLQEAILAGEWEVTGTGIVLRGDGTVADGQTRLEAIARSGMTVRSLVVRDIAETAFDVIDDGARRTPQDVLAIHGHTQTVARASAARGLILIERYGHLVDMGMKRSGLRNVEVLRYAEKHNDDLNEALYMSQQLRTARFIGGVGLWAIPLVLMRRVDAKQTTEYVNALVSGANLTEGHPLLRLRNMYMGGATNGSWRASADERERLVAIAIKAWNAWRAGETVRSLSWRKEGKGAEDFPMPK